MRIVSKDRDYYDCVQSQGQDHSLIYVRNRVRQDNPNWIGVQLKLYSDTILASQHIIGFCGKIYPMLMLEHKLNKSVSKQAVMCYNIDAVDNFVSNIYSKKQLTSYYSKANLMDSYFASIKHKSLSKWFDTYNQKSELYRKLFIKANKPIFVMSCYCNAGSTPSQFWDENLKQYEFYKIFDSYRAFQEIQMYLDVLKKPENPVPTMSDKIKIAARGFDKWSFRKRSKK